MLITMAKPATLAVNRGCRSASRVRVTPHRQHGMRVPGVGLGFVPTAAYSGAANFTVAGVRPRGAPV